jgi:hypothetical protein
LAKDKSKEPIHITRVTNIKNQIQRLQVDIEMGRPAPIEAMRELIIIMSEFMKKLLGDDAPDVRVDEEEGTVEQETDISDRD